MPVPAYIGDRASAAGYRLAGLQVHVADTGDVRALIERVCGEAPLVLLGADVAARLPVAELDRLLSQAEPAVVVVPDVRLRAELPDLATRLRVQLGMLE